MSQTKPLAAFSSVVSSAAAIALAWSAVDSLNDWGKTAPFAAGALGLHYVGVGIRRKHELDWDDHKAIAPEVWECLCEGYNDGLKQIQPLVTDIKEMPGLNWVSTPELDFSPILDHSAAIVAPSKTGKSFLMSSIMTERQRRFPNAPFTICSVDTWGRGHTWMGLADCPQWLQKIYIRLGFKYEDSSDSLDESIHKETIDEVEALYDLMQSRSKENRDGNGKNSEFEQALLIIDEFAQFNIYLEEKKRDDVRKKIKSLLIRGNKYATILYVIAQNDAVNMLGIPQSERAQLVICSLFKSDVQGDSARNALINSVNGRRVLFEYGGNGAIAPIPHMDSEPKLNWQPAIENGKFRGWVEGLASDIQRWKSDGATVTAAWEELTKRSDFPAKLKRQGRDNPDYVYFTDTIWSKIK